jgi:hypothetical protein
MAKRSQTKPSLIASGSVSPKIFEAMRSSEGRVSKGKPLTLAQAEDRRRAGQDVVVCGPDLGDNRRLAGLIERNANGTAKRCPPHVNAGARALPHYQPDPRPPDGHTFYETPNRKAF